MHSIITHALAAVAGGVLMFAYQWAKSGCCPAPKPAARVTEEIKK